MRITAVFPREDLLASFVDKLEMAGYNNQLSVAELDERLDYTDIDTRIDYQQGYGNDNSYVVSLDVVESNAQIMKSVFENSSALEVSVQH